MENLKIAKGGIFPITKDVHGKPLPNLPETGLQVAGTIQGEGKLAGIPVLFIRLAGCNLRCCWKMPDGSFSLCDTPQAAYQTDGFESRTIEYIVALIHTNLGQIKHVVISGGEPTLQHKALAVLCRKLKELGLHITLESNGTRFEPDLVQYIDLFSLSPKLSNAELTEKKNQASGLMVKDHHIFNSRRVNLKAIQSHIRLCQTTEKEFQLKFVLAGEEDAREIRETFLAKLDGWLPTDILAMPLGGKPSELKITTQHVLKIAIENGWRYCPRLHIELFGDKQGV